MRWFWIDRFTEFVAGDYAKAEKHISLSEAHVHDYLPGWPVLTSSFLVEGLAQTGGLLLSQSHNFQKKVVLAKLTKSTFKGLCLAGDTISFHTKIERLTDEGGIVKGICEKNGEVIVDADIVFAYLGDRFKGVELFTDHELMKMIRALQLFKVGRNQDGSGLNIPEHLLAAEKELPTQEARDFLDSLVKGAVNQ